MHAAPVPSLARQTRAHYRHELHTLTYVTIDQANGGIIRNLNDEGVAVQAVAPLRPEQRVRLRFELRFPRLRVDAYGHVSWANRSGQCGIRFVDMPAEIRHQINQWIFSNLLEGAARDGGPARSLLAGSVVSILREKNVREENVVRDYPWPESDGLSVSGAPRAAICLEPVLTQPNRVPEMEDESPADDPESESAWLSRPLSGRSLAWLVDGLVVTAALLIFALIFLSITHELPPWPMTVGAATAAAIFIVAAYRTMFIVFGRSSPGVSLAQSVSLENEEKDAEGNGRFR